MRATLICDFSPGILFKQSQGQIYSEVTPAEVQTVPS